MDTSIQARVQPTTVYPWRPARGAFGAILAAWSMCLFAGCDAGDSSRASDDELGDASAQAAITIQGEDAVVRNECTLEEGRGSEGGFLDFGWLDSYAQWWFLNEWEGEAEITIRYANGSDKSRPCTAEISGTDAETIEFEKTGSWSEWTTTSFSRTINSFTNMRITADTGAGGPNIDWIRITPLGIGPFGSDPVETPDETDPVETPDETDDSRDRLTKNHNSLRIASWNTNRGSTFPFYNEDNFNENDKCHRNKAGDPDPDWKNDPDWKKINLLCYGGNQRVYSAERIITATNADIWLFQEVSYGEKLPGQDVESLIEPYLEQITGGQWSTECRGNGLCIAIREPFSFEASCLPPKANRRAQLSVVDIGNMALLLGNMHLMKDDHSEDMAKTARRAVAAAKILAGDVNNRVDGLRLKDFTAANFTRVDAYQWNQAGDDVNFVLEYTVDDQIVREEHSPYHATIGRTELSDGRVTEATGSPIDHFFVDSSIPSPNNVTILNTFLLSDSSLSKYGLKQKDSALSPGNPDRKKSDGTAGHDHLPLFFDVDLSSLPQSTRWELCDESGNI